MAKSRKRETYETIFLLLVLAITLLAAIAVVIWLVAPLLTWEFWAGDDSKGTGLRNIAFAFGTPAALYLAFRRTNSATVQANTSIRQTNIVEKGQNVDRYQKSLELIASDDTVARIGGIVALQQLAEIDPDNYYFPVQHTLCCFISETSIRLCKDYRDENSNKTSMKPSTRDMMQALRSVSEIRTINNKERETLKSIMPTLTYLHIVDVDDVMSVDLSRFRIKVFRVHRSQIFFWNFSDSIMQLYSSDSKYTSNDFENTLFYGPGGTSPTIIQDTKFISCNFNACELDPFFVQDTTFIDCSCEDGLLADYIKENNGKAPSSSA